MTACSNSRRHGAVVAALVGAMSLGAPAVALAANGGIEVLSVGALGGGTLTAAEDGMRGTVTDLKGTVTLDAKSGQFLVPTEITDAAGNKLDVTDTDHFSLTYYRENGGKKLIGDLTAMENWMASTEGRYTTDGAKFYVVITNKQDTGDTKEITFDYAAEKQEVEYVAYDDKSGSVNFDDTTFVYTGSAVTPHFCSKKGDASSEAKTSGGWTITYTDAAGNTVKAEDLKNAGSYTAKLVKVDEVHYVKFAIEKLDLSTAALSVKDSTRSQVSTSDLLNALLGDAKDDAQVTSVKDPKGGNDLSAGQGLYEVTIAATKDSENVTGTATVKFWVLGTDLNSGGSTKACYGSNATGTVSIGLADGESFDASKVKVVVGDDTYKGDKVEVTYTDSNGKAVDASDLANPGTYKVTVRVVPFQDDDDNWVGGTFDMEVTVNAASMAADKTLAFTYDGKVVSGAMSVEYTGQDVLKGLGVQVKDADGNLLELGKDYKVVATDADGDEIDSIVDAANGYKVTVEGITFSFSDASSSKNVLTVNVSKKTLSDAADLQLMDYVDNNAYTATSVYDPSKDDSLFYTGAELDVPAVMVDTDETSKASFTELDPELYTVTKIQYSSTEAGTYKTVKSIKDEGYYKVTVKLTDEAAKNHTLADDTFEVQVKEKASFTDVSADSWYAQAVFTAKSLNYVNGISDTNLFMPEATISRADAVCILFNMAGGTVKDDDFQYNEDHGYVTGFDDVQGNEYFAKALAWAHAMGIANGNDGNFMPYEKITREQFAALLANYAKAMGDYSAPAEGAMDGIADADGVSGWATEVVAWAVENGVMGNKGSVYATNTITRAEVAAMAVNYQPEALK